MNFNAWIIAARPATLFAAIVPVFVGTAVVYQESEIKWGPAVAALMGAILLQIISNLANDVFDYEKGADTEERLGPTRVVQAGLLSSQQVKYGMFVTIFFVLLVGIYLVIVSGWPIFIVGILSIISAIAYTAGPYPLGYHGLGDVFVFIFFGIVAVCGTVFVQTNHVTSLTVLASVAIGALATAILVVNNVRDYQTDTQAKKLTLVARFGRRFGIIEYRVLLLIAYVIPWMIVNELHLSLFVLLPCITFPLGLWQLYVLKTTEGKALNQCLARTAQLLFLYGVLFSVGLILAK